jgi:hypothetical protein
MDAELERHACHWPGCGNTAPPGTGGCDEAHWYWSALPERLRYFVCITYRPWGGPPSAAHNEAVREAQAWIDGLATGGT